MLKNWTWLVIAVLAWMIGNPPFPAYAVANPDSISIKSVRVFQNLWTTGDQLFVIEYKVMYAADPSEDPADTFLAGIWSGSTPQFSRPLNYYGHNITSIYLTPSESLVWEGSYSVQVMGNPVYFDPLVEGTNMSTLGLPGSDAYWVSGIEEDSRFYLHNWALVLAEGLQVSWAVTLLTDEGRLNSTGSATFLTAIPGLNSIIPDFFTVSASVTGFDEYVFTGIYQDTLTERVGDRLKGALDNLGEFLHIPGELVGALGLGILYFTLAGRIVTSTGSAPAAIVISFPFLIAGSFMGLLPLAWLFVAIFMALVLFGVTFILVKA